MQVKKICRRPHYYRVTIQVWSPMKTCLFGLPQPTYLQSSLSRKSMKLREESEETIFLLSYGYALLQIGNAMGKVPEKNNVYNGKVYLIMSKI